MRVILALLFIAAVACGEQVSYEGYKLYGVTPATEDQLQILIDWEKNGAYDFWTHPHNGGVVDILVAPEQQPYFEFTLRLAQIRFEVKIQNLETVIEQERRSQENAPEYRSGPLSLVKYLRLAEINKYLNELATKYPDVVTVETYGKSTQGRDLKALRISKGGDGKRPVILVDAGIHAREWIAPAMGLYIIQQLVESQENSHLTENFDWLVIPVVNPDGYEYSHTNARMWRKTRSIDEATGCHGTDGNRNWDHHWSEAGSSNNPCSDTYHGKSAFSEPETQHLAEYAKKEASRIKFYLSFHSYGKYILYPWGYTRQLPEDDAKLREVGEIGHSAIRKLTGTRYTVGNTVEVLYAAAGGSHDYMKGELGIQLSYTLELPGGGLTGFDLPAGQIKGVVTETFTAVLAWHDYVLEHLKEL